MIVFELVISESHYHDWRGWNVQKRTYQRNIHLPQWGGRVHITVGKNEVVPTRLGVSTPSPQVIAWDALDPIEDWSFSLRLKDSVPSRLSWSHAELEKAGQFCGLIAGMRVEWKRSWSWTIKFIQPTQIYSPITLNFLNFIVPLVTKLSLNFL